MNIIKWFLICIIAGVLIGGGGYLVYGIAYAEGETIGYDQGYTSGEESGYSLGEQEGYDEGFESGCKEGYSEGYDEAYILGKQAGYSEGYDSGEDAGYLEGYNEGKENILEYSYTIIDPTYDEVLEYLEIDRTNENEYVDSIYNAYVCSHFARDVCNNAEEIGYRCAFVELRYPASAHAIVAFNTPDEGLVYFDPQSDYRVRPIEGENFYKCIEPEPGYYYIPPPFDDTITDIIVIW